MEAEPGQLLAITAGAKARAAMILRDMAQEEANETLLPRHRTAMARSLQRFEGGVTSSLAFSASSAAVLPCKSIASQLFQKPQNLCHDLRVLHPARDASLCTVVLDSSVSNDILGAQSQHREHRGHNSWHRVSEHSMVYEGALKSTLRS